jgi:hypothetical protein
VAFFGDFLREIGFIIQLNGVRKFSFSKPVMSLSEDNRSTIVGEVLPGPRVGVEAGEKLVDVEGNKFTSGDDASTLFENEEGHDIKYKTLTWKKVTTFSALLRLDRSAVVL